MSGPLSIFYFLVLMISIIVHEVAHGLAAEREGDPTARMLGRITLNPLKHLEWFGSVVLPLILILTTGFAIGWAKPVPYNPENLKRGKKSVAIVSIAGIAVNLAIALIFGLLIRGMVFYGVPTFEFATDPTGGYGRYFIITMIVSINIMLALFNAVPLAPLDGFRFLHSVIPRRFEFAMDIIERYSLPLLVIFVFFGWKFVTPFAVGIFRIISGI